MCDESMEPLPNYQIYKKITILESKITYDDYTYWIDHSIEKIVRNKDKLNWSSTITKNIEGHTLSKDLVLENSYKNAYRQTSGQECQNLITSTVDPELLKKKESLEQNLHKILKEGRDKLKESVVID